MRLIDESAAEELAGVIQDKIDEIESLKVLLRYYKTKVNDAEMHNKKLHNKSERLLEQLFDLEGRYDELLRDNNNYRYAISTGIEATKEIAPEVAQVLEDIIKGREEYEGI